MDKYISDSHGTYKRRVNSNANYDGYKRLAAAVIAKACSDWTNPKGNSHDSPEAQEEQKRRKRHSAKQFLEGDLQPWANFLELDVRENNAFKQWLKNSNLEGRLDKDPQGKLEAAKDFLRDILSNGARRSIKVKTRGETQGISWATLRRAKKALGVRASRNGPGWVWQLP